MADPISGAIMAIGSVISQLSISAPLLYAGAKIIATTALSRALSKPKGAGASGTELAFKADTSAGMPFAIGRTAVGGSIVFQLTAGPKNKHLNIIAVLSAGPCEAIETFFANKIATAFHAVTGSITTPGSPFAGRMWQKWTLGLLGAAALTQIPGAVGDSPVPEWTANHKLSGYAHAWWDVEYDAAKYPSGLPQPLWVGKWIKCYDPRQDSTYPGGSGAQRIDDENTWAWSQNPPVIALSFCRGWHTPDGKRRGGVGLTAAQIDIPAFVEAANVADANGWTCGGQFTTLDSKWGVLTDILQAGGAEPIKTGGIVSCLVSAPKVSLATVGVGDIASDITLPATKSRRERINSIIPRYRSEVHGWEMVSADPVTVADYVTFDGRLRQKGVDYVYVQDAAQVAQLAAYDIVNAREIGPIGISLRPHWIGYAPGDAITVNLPEIGLANQLMVIRTRKFDIKSGLVQVTLEYETTAKHAFALGQTASPPPTPGLTAPDFSTVPAPGSGQWTATPTSLSGGGASVPCITVTGSASDNAFAAEVIVEYRLHSGGDWTMWGSSPASSTTITVAGLGGTQVYDVAVSYKSIFGVVGARLILGPVTTPAGSGVASSIDNQGDLATRDDVEFGSGTIKETPGGTPATLDNFKTIMGTAWSFIGKTDWATYSGFTPDQVTKPSSNLVYDGGLRLRGQEWTLSGWNYGYGGDVGHYLVCTTAYQHAVSRRFPVFENNPYTFSYDIGGAGYAGVLVYLDWYDAAGDYMHNSDFGPVTPVLTGYHRQTKTVTAPTGARQAVFVVSSGNSFDVGGYIVIDKIKAELGAAATVFSDEATDGAIYSNGVNINVLRPLEFGANVTEGRVALSFAGRGDLASLNSVSLADGTVTNKSAAYISFSTSATVESLRPAEAGADPTGGHTALSFVGKGDLAVMNSVSLADGTVTNKTAVYISYSTSVSVESLRPSEAGADPTGGHTALSFIGKGDLATLNTVATIYIETDAVTTGKLATNAALAPVYVTASDPVTTDGATCSTATFDMDEDGLLVILFSGVVENLGPMAGDWSTQLYLDGSPIVSASDYMSNFTNEGDEASKMFASVFVDAGSHTVYAKWNQTGSRWKITDRQLTILRCPKVA